MKREEELKIEAEEEAKDDAERKIIFKKEAWERLSNEEKSEITEKKRWDTLTLVE